jgi:DNA-binding CsgD family transcriptional regulator
MAFYMAARIPRALETTERAYELARQVGGTTEALVGILLGGGRLIAGQDSGDGQRALLDRWPEASDDHMLIPAAPHLAGLLQFIGRLEIDLRRGRWAEARARSSEALRLAEASGQVDQRALPLTVLARLDAAMGREDSCRAAVHELEEYAAHAGMGTLRVYGEAALGLLELGLGRAERAVEHLDATARMCGDRDPSTIPFGPDRVEALVRAGEPERAQAALAEFEAQAARVRRSWPTAAAARCRGMLEADFELWFERAYAAHGPDVSPFELGRTELCHGERLRRARRVREARERLRSAIERFEALGAAPWAARALTELRAAGGAAGPAQEPATRELTPQELEVALAVATGATNREVAAALFVSPKTIEVHLSHIFKKLGLRSRTELARLMH